MDRGAAPPHAPGDRQALFTQRNQGAVACLCAFTLVLITTSWLVSVGSGDGLVDIDAADRLEASFQCDINSADWTELAQLPEIGEALAKRIVDWRESEGPFASHDDLDRVPGIGPKTLASVRPYLRPIE